MSPLSSATAASSSSHEPARAPPIRSEELFAPPKPLGEAPSSSEVLAEVAQRSQSFPPSSDSLTLSAAAARYSLTSLESAKEIAKEIRDTVQSSEADDAVAVASGARHIEIADTLLG